jgi:endonuclease/exonuclease/phosphatase family metal-dependent hydrolase
MFESFGTHVRKNLAGAVAMAISLPLFGATAAAQTIVLNQPGTQVTDTTLRSGSYANANLDNEPLETRRSSDPEWERRALLKFDTERTIPRGTRIASATLTLTVKSGYGSGSRGVSVFRVPVGFLEDEADWVYRMGSQRWSTPGGDVAEQVTTFSAPASAGSKIQIDLTSLVQKTINGDFDTRYTRIMLRDQGSDAKESLREYYGSEDSSSSRRPTLTVVLASTSSPSEPSTSGDTLKVLHWNISQGYGTDGKSNISRVVDFIVANKPDVISFNEIMRYSSSSQPKDIADQLKARTGKTWSYHWIQKTGASSGEGEAVMTHLPIETSDDFLLSVSRSVAMIRINVNGRNIHVFSTHLDHQSSSTRLTQVKQLVGWADNYAEQRIVAGDFNGWPGTQEINEMLKTYYDGWAVAKANGDAVAYASNPDGNTRNSRIDFVFHSKGATALSVTRAQVYDTRNSSGQRPSDHNPLIVTYRVR